MEGGELPQPLRQQQQARPQTAQLSDATHDATLPSSASTAPSRSQFTDNIQQFISISHFQQLMTIFQQSTGIDGAEGLDMPSFCEVFGRVLNGKLNKEQMTLLFMKIDANSDGTVSWDEFSTFVVKVGDANQQTTKPVVDERLRRIIDTPHKDMTKVIEYIAKERRYFSICRDWTICFWTAPRLKLARTFSLRNSSEIQPPSNNASSTKTAQSAKSSNSAKSAKSAIFSSRATANPLSKELGNSASIKDKSASTSSSKSSSSSATTAVSSKSETSWITNAVFMSDLNKLAVISDDRKLILYEMMSIKPRRIVTIAPLENSPLSICCTTLKVGEDRSVIAIGDDGGYSNIFTFTRRFFSDYGSDGDFNVIRPSQIAAREEYATSIGGNIGPTGFGASAGSGAGKSVMNSSSAHSTTGATSAISGASITNLSMNSLLINGTTPLMTSAAQKDNYSNAALNTAASLPSQITPSFKNGALTFQRRKIHNSWAEKIKCIKEINAFVSCSGESVKSVAISDIDRKTTRHISVPKGVRGFDYCRRPSFLITGGRDRILRLWNPYVLNKPAGSLAGHNAAICEVIVNQNDLQIISQSEDKVIKIWSIKSQQCLQSLTDRYNHRPENLISSIYLDVVHRLIVTGSNKLQVWPLYSSVRQQLVQSHDAPISCALFNHTFHQIVSGCESSSIKVWNVYSGEKTFYFDEVHGNSEITSMCFDNTGRRLITASRDGILKVWNFNNGQLLGQHVKKNKFEVTQVIYVETVANNFIICVGWDRLISLFVDNPSDPEGKPLKEIFDCVHGHQDDILCVCFLPPTYVITGALDGKIIVWSLETGSIRCQMSENLAISRDFEHKKCNNSVIVEDSRPQSDEDKVPGSKNADDDAIAKRPRAVEKVCALPKIANYTPNAVVASCHADGILRLWSALDSFLLATVEVFNIAHGERFNEGLTAVDTTSDNSLIAVGGSSGSVRIYSITHKPMFKDLSLDLVHAYRCHVARISSITFLPISNTIMTASTDCSVRMWKLDGTYIGSFGQAEIWNPENDATYGSTPEDVKLINSEEKKIREDEEERMQQKLRRGSMRATIERWQDSRAEVIMRNTHKGIVSAVESKAESRRNSIASADAEKSIALQISILAAAADESSLIQVKERILAIWAISRWKKLVRRNREKNRLKNAVNDNELMSIVADTNFFSYKPSVNETQHEQKKLNKPTVKIFSVKPEAVYKELVTHTKYELADVRLPERKSGHLNLRSNMSNLSGNNSMRQHFED